VNNVLCTRLPAQDETREAEIPAAKNPCGFSARESATTALLNDSSLVARHTCRQTFAFGRGLALHLAAPGEHIKVLPENADECRQDSWTKSFRLRRFAMSVSGISSISLYNPQSTQNNFQQLFQQLGKDLQSGDLSAAQSDFASLQQLVPQSSSTSSSQSTNPIAQAFNQLAQDLQSGNLSAAQQDFTTLKQDLQNQATQATQNQTQAVEGHHHHHGSGSSSDITQLLNELGQSLQSGNLSSAQSAFTTLQQALTQSTGQTSSQLTTSTVSLTA
jgi:outer membrane protein assembly factor BamD (BamD/ComL family)